MFNLERSNRRMARALMQSHEELSRQLDLQRKKTAAAEFNLLLARSDYENMRDLKWAERKKYTDARLRIIELEQEVNRACLTHDPYPQKGK